MNRSIALLLIIFLIIFSTREVESQNNVIYRFHYLHPAILNPAITGNEYVPVACLTYNKQWIGIQQSPYSMLASASIRIGNFGFYTPKKLLNTTKLKSSERIGLGILFFNDRNGPVTERGGNLAYAYHISLENAQLSLGLSGSIGQKILDETNLQPTYPGDPLLSGTKESFLFYNANAGAYYYSSSFFGGIAFHNLIPLEDEFESGSKVKPDMILHGGYLFTSLGKKKMEISTNIRFLDLDNLEYDIHYRFFIREVHWLALSYRSYNAVGMHVGIDVGSFYMAYSFEANLSSVARYQMGTHAVHLGINLGMKRINGF